VPLSDLFQALDILNHRSESIAAVMGSKNEANRFFIAIEALDKLTRDNNIPIAIVGGLGAIRYGYAAATEDIDIVVGDSDLEKFLGLASNYGFKIVWVAKSGWHTLAFGDVEINIVPEGRKARDTAPTAIPGPAQLGIETGLGYASLPGWIELKVSSARQKDFGHIVEVLKKIDREQIEQISQYLNQIHPDYQDTFKQLADQALAEKKQERRRE
jgi:hypothetical protein